MSPVKEIILSTFGREAAPIESQLYGHLNNCTTVIIPADMPVWMEAYAGIRWVQSAESEYTF